MNPMKEYRPELLSRKGELTAWITAALMSTSWIILVLTKKPVFPGIPFLAIFLLASALGISLGNWMDRQTLIQIKSDGVHYQNGLRNVFLKWEEIQQIQVFPSNWGRKVRLIGSGSHFDFRTLGEVKVQGEIKGRMGFTEGDMILDQILEKANLTSVTQNGNSYYYARE